MGTVCALLPLYTPQSTLPLLMASDSYFETGSIRDGRKIKKLVRANGVYIGGKTSGVFSEHIAPEIESRVSRIVETNREWLEAELSKVSASLRGKKIISFDELIPYFQGTLKKRFKLYARTNKQSLKAVGADTALIDTLSKQAAFDFIMSLRASAQDGETLNNALKIALRSHWLNPFDIKNLITTYAEKVDASVIKYATLHNPKNPDAFIEWFIDAEHFLLTTITPRAPKRSIVHGVLLSNAFKNSEQLSRLV